MKYNNRQEKIMKRIKNSLIIAPFLYFGMVSFSHLKKSDEKKDSTEVASDTNEVYYTTDGRLLTKELAAEISLKNKNTSFGKKELSSFEKVVLNEYLTLDEGNFEKPNLDAFKTALKGYYNLKEKGLIQSDILTLIDFSKSSKERRMWVMNMKTKRVLFHNVVSHGKNSGMEFVTSFSNTPESNKSSIGFYRTAETYYGNNGLSLRLDGLEPGFNDNARARAIVMHGADYCDEALAKRQGYLGRSYGCPSVPRELNKKIIEAVKEGSCLFIYNKDEYYLNHSKLL